MKRVVVGQSSLEDGFLWASLVSPADRHSSWYLYTILMDKRPNRAFHSDGDVVSLRSTLSGETARRAVDHQLVVKDTLVEGWLMGSGSYSSHFDLSSLDHSSGEKLVATVQRYAEATEKLEDLPQDWGLTAILLVQEFLQGHRSAVGRAAAVLSSQREEESPYEALELSFREMGAGTYE